MIKTNITKDERYLLREYFRTSLIKLIRLKAQAILMREEGLKLSVMSKLLFRDSRTIKRWIKDFSQRRMASIFSGHENNENAGKLTKEQKEEIAETLKQSPSEYGLPKQFWDPPALKEYIKAEFKTVYESRQSYYFLLKFSNLTFKLPDKFDYHRDENLINKRMKEINDEIKEYLNSKQWEVLTADETRIQLEAITKRAWLQKGEKTIVKIERSNEYQNYIGLLDQKTFKCHLYELEWQNQEEIIKSLERFLKNYPNKRICLIWDNAKFHKGKLIRDHLKKGKTLQNLHLINFPPYAPDKNPVEHIWKETKQKISNIQFKSFKETKIAFRKAVTQRKFHYQM